MKAELVMMEKQETLLQEERTARMNAVNELKALQAKIARLEVAQESDSATVKRRGVWNR